MILPVFTLPQLQFREIFEIFLSVPLQNLKDAFNKQLVAEG